MANSGAIRYNYTKQAWEFSNDRSTYKEIEEKGHRHVSAEITDASANANANAIVRRGPAAEASFGRLNVDTSYLSGSYWKMGTSNAITDPHAQTTTNFTIAGTASNFKTTVQDGGGRVNFLWNASSSLGKYLVGNEGAGRMMLHVNDNGLNWGLYSAAKGASNQDITWIRNIELKDGIFEFGPADDPAGTIDSIGNISMRGTFYGLGFETQSARELKSEINEYKEDALTLLNALNIYTYKYKNDISQQTHVGIIADEVEETLISGDNHDRFNTSNTLGILIKAVQQLAAKVGKLEAKIK